MKKIILSILVLLIFSSCAEKYKINNLSVKNNTATIRFEHDTNFPWVPSKPVTHYYLPNTSLKCSNVLNVSKVLNYDGQLIEAGKYFSIYSSYLGPNYYGKFKYQCNIRIKFLPKKGNSYLLKVSHHQPHCNVTLLQDLGKGKYVNVPFTKESLCIE